MTPTGYRGFNSRTLDALTAAARPTIVLATAGGKSLGAYAGGLPQLYSDERVRTVSLFGDLSEAEEGRARARCEPSVAGEIVHHGIGEFLVAAPELARKLDEERHRPGDPPYPNGAAVVWAAIDWTRSGMVDPITKSLLFDLWKHYLAGRHANAEEFERALAWAITPVLRTIALVNEVGDIEGYDAYEWVVARASQQRDVNRAAWQHILSLADSSGALRLGLAVRRARIRA